MKKLTKNYWRLGWVVLVNAAVILFLITSPIRHYHKESEIFQALRTPQPPFAFWSLFLETAWAPAFTTAMLLGILAEVRRSILSPIFNVVPFLIPLIWGVVDWMRSNGSYSGERSLGIAIGVGLCLIGLVNAAFYLLAFRKPGQAVVTDLP